MASFPWIFGLLLAASGTGAAERASSEPISDVVFAMLPLRNLSEEPSAPAEVRAALQAALEARGARFVDVEALEAKLRERRVRYTDSISAADAKAVAPALGAQFVIVGTVLDFARGTEPRVALSLRVVSTDSGERVGSAVATLRGQDFEGLLGLGRIEDGDTLLALAVERLCGAFDEHGMPLASPSEPERRGRANRPEGGSGFMLPDFDPAALERVALLPFSNRSSDSDAPQALAEFVGDAWYHSSGVRVVEPAEVRAALVRLAVRSTEFVDRRGLARLGGELGARYFVLGSIERFGESSLAGNERLPEFEATLQIVDVESGRTMAAAGVHRRGDHDQTLLGLGAVRDPLELAARSARELVAGLGG